jgi:hypothetical protein
MITKFKKKSRLIREKSGFQIQYPTDYPLMVPQEPTI